MSLSDRAIENLTLWMLATIVIAILLGIHIIQARFEARAYNRICNPERPASTWDALVLELRVDACNVQEKEQLDRVNL